MVKKRRSKLISKDEESGDSENISEIAEKASKVTTPIENGEVETMEEDTDIKQNGTTDTDSDMDVDSMDQAGSNSDIANEPEADNILEEEGTEVEDAELSLCDASFSAADSVPTSGHTRLSKCTEGVQQFLEAVHEHGDRESEFDLEESLGILTLEEMSALWVSLKTYITTAMLSIVGGMQSDDDAQSLEVVVGVVMVAKFCIPLPLMKGDSFPQALLQTVSLLHSVLPNIEDPKLNNNICQVLESWYVQELPDRDSLTTNCLVALLTRSLGPQGTKADVRRVWILHQTVLGFRLGESEQLRSQLVSTAGSTLYLTCPDGVRWLVFLFSLSPDMVSRLHKQVKTSLPSFSSSKAACAGVGDVYHKSWLASGGQFKKSLEQDCIQDLMYRGVLAPRGKGGLAVAITRILGVFHQQKRSPVTQSMLARLYDPILWRHLKVANSIVRLNACELFLSCYPLENQEVTREERDNCLDMQHTYMINLLKDENPAVRCAAISGVCAVLASYWLLVPSDTINQIVTLLIKENLWDSSSARVRLVTISGIKALLICPHSHVYLKVVLPKLSDCLHDNNEGVRGAMMDLLLAVKGVRSIKFWNICTLEHLLARLVVDKPFMCRRIVKLLYNSYIPPNQGDEVKLERLIHLVQTNRAASRRFYQYCGEMMDVPGVVQLMVAVLTSVKIWVKAKMAGREGEVDDEDKENSFRRRRRLYSNSIMSDDTDLSVSASDISNQSGTVLENTTVNGTNAENEEPVEVDDDHPYNDPAVVAGVLDIVCILWLARNRELSQPEHDQYRAVLEKKASRWLTLFFKQFRGTSACDSVVYLASFLPERVVAPVASYCLSRVKGEEGWKTYVDCLCNWRKGDSLLEVVTQGIKGGLGRGKVAKGVRFEETQSKEVQLRLAVKLLEYLVNHHGNRAILMAKNRPMLEECLELCLSVQETIDHKLGFSDDVEDISMNKDLAQLVVLAGQMIIVLHTESVLSKVEELLAWAERELMPVVFGPSDNNSNSSHIPRTRGQVSLCEAVLRNLCSMSTCCLTLGLSDPEFTAKVLDWAVQLLYSGGAGHVGDVLQLLGEAARKAGIGKRREWEELYQDKIQVGFAKLLSWLTKHSDKLEEYEGGVARLKKGVSVFTKVYSKHRDRDSWVDLVDVTSAAVLAIVKKKVVGMGEVVIPSSVGELGTISGLLVESLIKQQSSNLIGQYLSGVFEDLDEEEDSVGGLTGAVLMLVSVVTCNNKEEVIDKIEVVIGKELEKEEVDGERMGERELVKEVKAACKEVRGRLGLVDS